MLVSQWLCSKMLIIILGLSNVSISVVVLEDVDHHSRSIKCWYLSGCVRSIKCWYLSGCVRRC